MITLNILDYNGTFVKQWQWQEQMPVPNNGDTLLIHFGDKNEEEYRVNVLRREFDGTKPGVISIVTDYVKFNPKDVEETMLP